MQACRLGLESGNAKPLAVRIGLNIMLLNGIVSDLESLRLHKKLCGSGFAGFSNARDAVRVIDRLMHECVLGKHGCGPQPAVNSAAMRQPPHAWHRINSIIKYPVYCAEGHEQHESILTSDSRQAGFEQVYATKKTRHCAASLDGSSTATDSQSVPTRTSLTQAEAYEIRQMGNQFGLLKRNKSLQPEEDEQTRLAKERRRKLLQPELPRLIGGSKNEVLSNPRLASTLVPQLQASLTCSRRCHDWKLLYNLAQDGCSLHTLLRKGRKQNPTLVIVETTTGDVFGGFASEEWQDSANYYGIGESFVFSFNSKFECYPWSYLNTMIMFSNDECIAMGGGGDFAWCLNSDLSRGTSGYSKTFENKCLTTEPEFAIYNVELWGFVMKM